MSLGTEAKPAAGDHQTPEHDVREEWKDVARVIALQTATLDEVRHDMFPMGKEVNKFFTRPLSRKTARVLFKQLYSPVPQLTRMIWEFKVGGKSPNMYTLPGGKIDIQNPTPEDIVSEGLRELRDETGHVTRNARLRDDCSRWYGFTMQDGNVITRRRNHESLVVAYIPRGQSTKRRFVENENIKIAQRFTLEQVSHLLHDEIHVSSAYPGTLIDNLSLNPERHSKYGTIINPADTLHTKHAVESEMWIYEATIWKRLALELIQQQPTGRRDRFRRQAHTLMSIADPQDIEHAISLMGIIRALLPRIEQSYHVTQSQKASFRKHRHIQTLIHAGVQEQVIYKRLALIQDIELAYTTVFHTKKRHKQRIKKDRTK